MWAAAQNGNPTAHYFKPDVIRTNGRLRKVYRPICDTRPPELSEMFVKYWRETDKNKCPTCKVMHA